VMIARAGDKHSFHKASLFLKFIMVAGLLYMVAVRFILHSFA